MKKLCTAFACMALLLCGCAAGEDEAATRIIEATAGGYTINGTAQIESIDMPIGISATNADNSLTIELTAPEQVSGLLLSFCEGTVQVSYRGMQINMKNSDLPSLSVFAALRDVLSALPPAADQITREGDTLRVKQLGNGTAAMVWSHDGTTLQAIEMPHAGAVLLVENFVLMP